MNLKARTAVATLQASPADDDQVPDAGLTVMLATSRMIEVMEVAASRLMQQHLVDGQTSVGIEMNITHRATGPVCGLVRAVATYDGFSGRLHRFTFNVFDESGLIGSGEHIRTSARRAAVRCPGPSGQSASRATG